MKVVFIRHGKTAGNLKRKYIGRTDEPLCEEGRREIIARREKYPDADFLFTSTKLRCLETARLIYPALSPVCLRGFDECDFGEFEGKNYLELAGNEDYQKFIDSGATAPFPGGETPEDFKQRCRQAFFELFLILKNTEKQDNTDRSAAFVVHGGTIMSVFSAFAEDKKDYYSWQVGNGEGFTAQLNMQGSVPVFTKIQKI